MLASIDNQLKTGINTSISNSVIACILNYHTTSNSLVGVLSRMMPYAGVVSVGDNGKVQSSQLMILLVVLKYY